MADAKGIGTIMNPRGNKARVMNPNTEERVSKKVVTFGEVMLRLFKGSVTVIGRSSPWALYSEEMVSFDEKTFDQSEMAGAVKVFGLQSRMYRALRDQRGG